MKEYDGIGENQLEELTDAGLVISNNARHQMTTRRPPAAAEDLRQISDYIRADDPDAARRMTKRICGRAATPGTHPHRGRRGRVVLANFNIIRGAQRRPPGD